MSLTKKNTQKVTSNVEDYMTHLQEKCEACIDYSKSAKAKKATDDEIPTITSYHLLTTNSYNAPQLKKFAKHYKLKLSGNKKELISRIYCFLKLSAFIIKIQKVVRGRLQRKCNSYRGPAFFKREKCTNERDFLSDDLLTTLPASQFFSYEDTDKFIYGFDIISLFNLILKSGREVKNPYNRSPIPPSVVQTMRNLIRFSKMLKVQINVDIKEEVDEISPEKHIEMKVLDLFQNIDALGNYSSPSWFNTLNRVQLIRFLRELIDIWTYRANLSIEVKRQICPPMGDPFRNFSFQQLNHEPNITSMRKSILVILEKFVNSGVDRDSKALGAYYVLGSLTLVNENAATALPWLFQSLAYF
jgi:SAP domain